MKAYMEIFKVFITHKQETITDCEATRINKMCIDTVKGHE